MILIITFTTLNEDQLNVKFTYDINGKLLEEIDSLGNKLSYDSVGKPTSTDYNLYNFVGNNPYASNNPGGGMLQPGGLPWPSGGPTPTELFARTAGDLGPAHDCSQDCPKCYRKIMEVYYNYDKGYPGSSLSLLGGWDFHWYRQDDDGTWSHKPGRTPSRRTDESGNIIIDPRTANRGDYKYIIGCWCVEDRYQGTEGY